MRTTTRGAGPGPGQSPTMRRVASTPVVPGSVVSLPWTIPSARSRVLLVGSREARLYGRDGNGDGQEAYDERQSDGHTGQRSGSAVPAERT
ncbi:hypothetical protein AB0I51_22520 [Streptomyces sp. NPDC050549]|uniref:hypothetical protein n=1 Tax=Streptomyces sp. NPDC050549 TaxID=3155406 RepID=UPI003425424C